MSDRIERMKQLTAQSFEKKYMQTPAKTRVAHCEACAMYNNGAKTRIAIPHTCELADNPKQSLRKKRK